MKDTCSTDHSTNRLLAMCCYVASYKGGRSQIFFATGYIIMTFASDPLPPLASQGIPRHFDFMTAFTHRQLT